MYGATLTSAPSVGLNSDGRLSVFARGSNNDLLHRAHDTTASTSWGPWSSLGGILTSSPSAGRNANNNIEVFVRNDRQGAHRIYQSSSGWSAWIEMGGVIKGAPVPVNNSTGKLEIYSTGAEGHYRLIQLQTDGSWTTTWELLGQP